ncbi:hypothetical protein IE81DRAFT_326704 [Ceraceosorus guamensis]|uniref:Uncharacterized protein n=1 Tax=Ceraceosorus guamensis TaxID=1522189 RepID=A0A316VP15_9BASI|nr:hypothetical protein IE81DRAFT_326704 [Ceraceosorus guamensis]PWN39272.1 hypothetical protein IE81DRAFT_326704 [Ceraceosorus guamensis]
MVIGTVAGWAGAGFLTRCWALAIQKRNIFDGLGGHAAFMGAFGAIGYWAYGLEDRQLELIKQKKEQILRNRENLAAKLSGGGAQEEE